MSSQSSSPQTSSASSASSPSSACPSSSQASSSRQRRLQELVDIFSDPSPGDAPFAIAVTFRGPEGEIAIIPLDPRSVDQADQADRADRVDPFDPVEALTRIDCPASWDAFGLVTRGTATSLRADDDLHERVQVAVVVDRIGNTASAVRALDGGVLCDGHIDLCEGRVPDACRRVLGVSTAPPPAEPFTLLTLQWADALAEIGATAPGTLTWPDALAARPFNPRSTWTELRLGVASAALQLPGISCDLAAFMDDGMFAREAVASSPSPRQLFEILSATVPSDVLQRLVDHLDDLADDLHLR